MLFCVHAWLEKIFCAHLHIFYTKTSLSACTNVLLSVISIVFLRYGRYVGIDILYGSSLVQFAIKNVNVNQASLLTSAQTAAVQVDGFWRHSPLDTIDLLTAFSEG